MTEETPEEYLERQDFYRQLPNENAEKIDYAIALARKQEQEKWENAYMSDDEDEEENKIAKIAFERGKKVGLQISAATDPFFLRDQITKEIEARVRQETAKFILKEIEKLVADFKEQKGYSGREGYILNHLRLFIETEYLSAPEKKEEKNDRKKNP